nr:hypothetical protein K-LCC10_0248 [Kaumoebavirus]
MSRKISPPFLVNFLDQHLCKDAVDEVLKYYAAPTRVVLPEISWATENGVPIFMKCRGDKMISTFYCKNCHSPNVSYIDFLAEDAEYDHVLLETPLNHCHKVYYTDEEDLAEYRKEVKKFYLE